MLNVSVEILRPGSYDNMVVNPITAYIGVCGNYPPVTFNVNLKHRDLLESIRALRYKVRDNGNPYEYQIERFKEKISNILGNIQGIDRELESMKSRAWNGIESHDDWLNVRLIINAKELALIPFEMTNAFHGASNNPLAVDGNFKAIITREIRQGNKPSKPWPRKPKILFIASNTSEERPIPQVEHLKALRSAIKPWTKPNQDGITENWESSLDYIFDASIYQIQRKCEKTEYDYIHILAHGAAVPGEEGFGLKFWNRQENSTDVITGEQLVTALKIKNQYDRCHTPTLVTLAACDAGNQGSSILPGASIAHSLHEGGVQYVLASQFPLTIEGSVSMTWEFYKEIFKGKDPRIATFKVRQILYNNFQPWHDWGSIVAYSNLTESFDADYRWMQLDREIERLKAIQLWLEKCFDKLPKPVQKKNNPEKLIQDSQLKANQENSESIENYRKAIKKSASNLIRFHGEYVELKKQDSDYKCELEGMIGSAYKRLAEIDFQLLMCPEAESREKHWQSAIDSLTDSRLWYKNGFQTNPTSHWTMVQFLFVSFILESISKKSTKPLLIFRDKKYQRVWDLGRYFAELEIAKAKSDGDKVWACFSLAELYLIAPLTVPNSENTKSQDKMALEYLKEGIQFAKQESWPLESTARQFGRHVEWWGLVKKMWTNNRIELDECVNAILVLAETCLEELNR